MKDKLREYRTEMNQKYPDPQKKPKAEESDEGGKFGPGKAQAGKKGAAAEQKQAKEASPAPTAMDALSGADSG